MIFAMRDFDRAFTLRLFIRGESWSSDGRLRTWVAVTIFIARLPAVNNNLEKQYESRGVQGDTEMGELLIIWIDSVIITFISDALPC